MAKGIAPPKYAVLRREELRTPTGILYTAVRYLELEGDRHPGEVSLRVVAIGLRKRKARRMAAEMNLVEAVLES